MITLLFYHTSVYLRIADIIDFIEFLLDFMESKVQEDAALY